MFHAGVSQVKYARVFTKGAMEVTLAVLSHALLIGYVFYKNNTQAPS